jgi:hypothetical protein
LCAPAVHGNQKNGQETGLKEGTLKIELTREYIGTRLLSIEDERSVS